MSSECLIRSKRILRLCNRRQKKCLAELYEKDSHLEQLQLHLGYAIFIENSKMLTAKFLPKHPLIPLPKGKLGPLLGSKAPFESSHLSGVKALLVPGFQKPTFLEASSARSPNQPGDSSKPR